MSISIDNIVETLDAVQLPYYKLSAKEFMDSCASRPESSSIKTQVPSYFSDILEGFNIHTFTPSGITDSMWHCLLYIFARDRYNLSSWEQKKKYIEKFIEELDKKINLQYTSKSIVMRNTTYNPNDLKFRGVKFITDALLFAVAHCLNINILILERINWKFHYGDPVINTSLPLIILNKDHQQIYSVVSVHEQFVYDSSHPVNQALQPFLPKNNKYLKSILRDRSARNESDREFVRLVKGQSIDEAKMESLSKELSRLNLSELKVLATEAGHDLSQLSGRITKARLIELINQ